VVFGVGKEMFGIPIESIREIVRVPEITEVPDAPEFFEGVMNLRGKVVPVVDLGKKLRLKGNGRAKATRVLIAEEGDKNVGLIVDSVAEVMKIQPESVDEPPDMVSAVGIEYITGVAKVDEKLVILLDLQRVLNVKELQALKDEAEAFAEAEAA